MKFRKRMRGETGELRMLDIAPLIDIVFLLLIFFMLTSNLIVQPGIRVSLPKAITSEALYKKGLVIIINEKNELFLNERPISMGELINLLGIVAKDEKSVLIKADRRSSVGKIVEIWDLCRDEGVSEINVATSGE